MNGTLRVGGVLAGLLLIGLAVWSGYAHTAAPPTAPRAGTRVGVFNLQHAIKSYDRFKMFESEMKKSMERMKGRFDERKAEGDLLSQELREDGLTPARKSAIEKRLRVLSREIEDIRAETSEAVKRKQDGQVQGVYSDIEAACRRYAARHGFDLILHYSDAVTPSDRASSANITRKMQAGALMPIFTGPGIDITREIIAELNETFKRSSS